MNYYIDFDNTLYDTTVLAKDMCNIVAENIHSKTNKSVEDCKKEVNSYFNRRKIYNIYQLLRFFSTKYNLDYNKLESDINYLILNGSKNVYDDSIEFLKNLKKHDNTVYILTYASNEDFSYQLLKINGSKLCNYVDDIIITSTYKFNLDINYSKCIFIDDNPRDLLGINLKHPFKLIRIKRPDNKYSLKNLNIKIDEYQSLRDIPI